MKKLVITLAVLTPLTSALSQPIAYEGFAIPPYAGTGPLSAAPNNSANPAAWNAGAQWYGDGATSSSLTLSYDVLPSSEGHAVFNNVNGRSSRKLILDSNILGTLIDGGKIGGANASGNLYLSFMMTVPTAGSFSALELHDNVNADPNRRFEIRWNGSEFEARAATDATPGTDSAGDASQNLGSSAGANFFVVKFQFNAGASNDIITVWRNPQLGVTDAPGGFTLTNVFDSQFTELSIANFGGGLVRFDEFRLGTTWAAVAIPEPSTYALIIGGSLLLGYIVRRRRDSN